MNLPLHRLKDLRDGMNPATTLAVYCVNCGDYIGKWRELMSDEEFDEDEVECDLCLGGEDDVYGLPKTD